MNMKKLKIGSFARVDISETESLNFFFFPPGTQWQESALSCIMEKRLWKEMVERKQ